MEYSAATIIYIPLANWGEGLEVFRKGEFDKRAQHQKIGFYDYITCYNYTKFWKTTRDDPLSTYAKFSEIRTRTCAYQGVRNVSFSENFAYVLNG